MNKRFTVSEHLKSTSGCTDSIRGSALEERKKEKRKKEKRRKNNNNKQTNKQKIF